MHVPFFFVSSEDLGSLVTFFCYSADKHVKQVFHQMGPCEAKVSKNKIERQVCD